MQKQKVKTCSEFSFAKRIRGLAPRNHRGAYMPPMISRKKKVFGQFLLHTLRATKNRVTHRKAGLYLKKQKNGGRFKIAECNMTGRISSIFCIFYLFALKWP